MPSNITPSTENEMLWEWARAEVNSPRFNNLYSAIPASIRSVVAANAAARLSPSAHAAVLMVTAQVRAPLLAGLRRLGTTWSKAKLTAEEVSNLEIMHYPPFTAICPTHRLADFAKTLDSGIAPLDEPQFLANYREVRKRPPTPMNGVPILVARSMNGPFAVVEGNTRLCDLVSRVQAGTSGSLVDVLIGVCPRLDEWYLHDNPVAARLA